MNSSNYSFIKDNYKNRTGFVVYGSGPTGTKKTKVRFGIRAPEKTRRKIFSAFYLLDKDFKILTKQQQEQEQDEICHYKKVE